MKAKFQSAWGYQDDAMNLPVADVEAAVPFYERIMGFRVESRGDEPHRHAILERDGVKMGLVENGADPTQDGVAFRVDSAEAAWSEFKASGLEQERPKFSTEDHDGESFKVFYVVAPDGLCYWFGEKLSK